jgi:hypothetical protein
MDELVTVPSPPCDAGTAPRSDDVVARLSATLPFVLIGSTLTIAGGLVAAVSRPTGFAHGSWLAAYLVLVGGVAQIGLGAGQAWLAEKPPSRSATMVELTTWNVGIVAVIIGTLLGTPVVTTLGAAASVGSIAIFLARSRYTRLEHPRLCVLYRGISVIVLVSSPIGIALAWIRHS